MGVDTRGGTKRGAEGTEQRVGVLGALCSTLKILCYRGVRRKGSKGGHRMPEAECGKAKRLGSWKA